MAKLSLKDWMDTTQPEKSVVDLSILQERHGVRSRITAAIQGTVLDHLADLSLLERIGEFKKVIAFIRNKVPTKKRVRSGDLGEILATEYIDQCTEYRVPIKRLRWKDDRDTTMRGDDVIAIKPGSKQRRLLKAESKSRASLSDSVIEEAVAGLEKHSGRPNPSSLAFISSRLRELGRDDEAKVFEDLQSRKVKADDIEHLVFTLSGNDPTRFLKKQRRTGTKRRRYLVGCVIADHQDFIKTTFDRIHAGTNVKNRRTS